VKNSSLEEILTVMLAQLEGGLRGYIGILDITNKTKREKKILNFTVTYNLMVANIGISDITNKTEREKKS
jgi:hypothetical protein